MSSLPSSQIGTILRHSKGIELTGPLSSFLWIKPVFMQPDILQAETISQAISMRPDLYAAYLHGASQWDGEYAPIAENGVAVYIFMAQNDEYYGSERAWSAYNSLRDAYVEAGWNEIDIVLQIQTPDNNWFAQRGVTGNYHGGGNLVFDETEILEWVTNHQKGGNTQK